MPEAVSQLPFATRRTRGDRCPGVARPWPAEDGMLVRLRLIGGRITSSELRALAAISQEHGDGDLHLTARANLQLRGLPADPRDPTHLRADVAVALRATGLIPSPAHEIARNVMVSAQTGLAGGRADLTPIARELDQLLCADPGLAALPGRFLFALDDGRGDLIDTRCDLGLVAVDRATAQLRVGESWGPIVNLGEAPRALLALGTRFLDVRGTGPQAAWHVAELPEPLVETTAPDPRLPGPCGPLPFGVVPGGEHIAVPHGVLDQLAVRSLVTRGSLLILTPRHGVLVPEGDR